MKTFFRRLTLPAGLRRKWVVMPAVGVLVLAIIGGLWFLGHSGANSVWNQPSVPISDVLDRVDRGQVATASISRQRILLTDSPGRQSWSAGGTHAAGHPAGRPPRHRQDGPLPRGGGRGQGSLLLLEWLGLRRDVRRRRRGARARPLQARQEKRTVHRLSR